MKVTDKRTPNTNAKEFGEVPVGTVFEFPIGSEGAEYYRFCMKIESSDYDNNTIDVEDCTTFYTAPNEKIHELNAHLVIEGRE